MFFKRKNPNADAFKNAEKTPAAPINTQPVTAPAAQSSDNSDSSPYTLDQLLNYVKMVPDDSSKAKFYYLIAMYYYKGTNGAVKDVNKSIEYLNLCLEKDTQNASAYSLRGSISALNCIKSGDNSKLSKAVTDLIVAHKLGDKTAINTLDIIAEAGLLRDCKTGQDILNLIENN